MSTPVEVMRLTAGTCWMCTAPALVRQTSRAHLRRSLRRGPHAHVVANPKNGAGVLSRVLAAEVHAHPASGFVVIGAGRARHASLHSPAWLDPLGHPQNVDELNFEEEG